MTTIDYEKVAEDATQRALDGIRNGEGDEVAAALSLAVAAWDALTGFASDDSLRDLNDFLNDPGPACICPAELVARGGFKGGCPVHGGFPASNG